MFNQTLKIRNAEITIKVVKVEGGFQVQSALNCNEPGREQQLMAYGKTYKSQTRANKEAAKWVEHQQK